MLAALMYLSCGHPHSLHLSQKAHSEKKTKKKQGQFTCNRLHTKEHFTCNGWSTKGQFTCNKTTQMSMYRKITRRTKLAGQPFLDILKYCILMHVLYCMVPPSQCIRCHILLPQHPPHNQQHQQTAASGSDSDGYLLCCMNTQTDSKMTLQNKDG